MANRYVELYCDTQTPGVVLDANGAAVTADTLRLSYGETVVFRVTVKTAGVAAVLTGLAAKLTGKSPDDRDNATPLLLSVDNSDGWASLAAGLIPITVNTATVAMGAYLTDRKPARRVLLSLRIYSGATGERFLATELEATVVRPAEATGDAQPAYPANVALTALAALTPAANKLPYFTSADAAALADLTAFARTLLDDSDAAMMRATLGVDAAGTAQGLITAHTHAGTTNGPKLAQANTHESPDTDAAPTSLHHTVGTGANQAAAGNHAHSGVYDPAGTAAAAVDALDVLSDVDPTSINVRVPNQAWAKQGTITITGVTGAAAAKLYRATLLITATGGTLIVNLPAAWLYPSGNKPASDQFTLLVGEQAQLIVESWGTGAVVAYYAKLET